MPILCISIERHDIEYLWKMVVHSEYENLSPQADTELKPFGLRAPQDPTESLVSSKILASTVTISQFQAFWFVNALFSPPPPPHRYIMFSFLHPFIISQDRLPDG